MADSDRPTPPDELPKYVVDPVGKQSVRRLEKLHDWIEKLIEWKSAIQDESELADENEEIVEVEESEGGTVVIKKVPCGKDNCSTCPHGPYKYVVQRKKNKLHWDYRGAVDTK